MRLLYEGTHAKAASIAAKVSSLIDGSSFIQLLLKVITELMKRTVVSLVTKLGNHMHILENVLEQERIEVNTHDR